MFKKFCMQNKQYVLFLLITLLGIIIFNILFLKGEKSEYKNIGKVWEIAGCVLTLVYTYWFWFLSDNGKNLLNKISIKDIRIKRLANISIKFALFILILVILGNIYLTIDGNANLGFLSLFCAGLIFIIFCHIDSVIIAALPQKSKDRRDLKFAYYNSDIPTLIAFMFLSIYSLFMYENMEIFYSGAMAFQMILSTVIWANTDLA